RHRLQMLARLAQLDAVALDVADTELLADEIVQLHAAHGDLPARLAHAEPDVLDVLGLDERQRLPGLRAVGVEVPVALEPLASERPHGVDRLQRSRFLRPDVDCLDHLPVMKETRAASFVALKVEPKFDGMTPFGKPGEMNAFGSVIDCFTNASNAMPAVFASFAGAVSRSGPTFALVPAALNV